MLRCDDIVRPRRVLGQGVVPVRAGPLGLPTRGNVFVLTHFPPNPAYYASHQMFGDAVRLPRFVLELNGSLTTLDTGEELKQRLLDPTGGALTVESDRPVIECLSLVAHHLRASLWFGVSPPDLL